MNRPETAAQPASATTTPGNWREVLRVFLKLGLTSFGGPIAHLGYYREEIVVRRQWLSESAYADLVALCQFLPGPASSQTNFALGWMRAGPAGALAAWAAFTLPSAVLLVLFAFGAAIAEGAAWNGLLHGLKLVAVAIVAQAVWGMARTLSPERERASIAAVAALLALLAPSSIGQIAAIVLGGVAGLVACREEARPVGHLAASISRRTGSLALFVFFALLLLLPIVTTAGTSQGLAMFDAFYRAGALVFGGGHVVLPLLQAEVVPAGWIDNEAFLAGYGAAQAIPGPLFTFAAYLGAAAQPEPNGWAGAAIALVAVFLPGLLLIVGALPFWEALRRQTWSQAMMRGANAAVVGILGAALYDPLWTSAVRTAGDFGLALVAFVLLVAWKAPPWLVVLVTALGSVGMVLV